MNVGKRIQARRKELNMTVEELAKRLNKNRTTVYRYEKGDIENLPLDALKPLAEILETSPAYLMGWEDEPNEDVATVGDLLKLIRVQLNVSIEEFARNLGISPEKLRVYESGEKYTPIKIINMIADYYRLSTSKFTNRPRNISEESNIRIERFKFWAENFNHLDFTDEEHDKIVEYAKFLIYMRGE